MLTALQSLVQSFDREEAVWNWSRLDGLLARGLERIAAGALLVVCLPVLLVLFAMHRLLEGRRVPFLYTGERIGRGGESFTIYKIRTLVLGADRHLEGRLHDPDRDARLELRMGSFLRVTRLDELPQLWNIVRGDMAFVGPRPERPCVYRTHCLQIPGYSRRFEHLPGLTGLSQFLTPHGAPKTLRARLDGIMMRKMKDPLWTLGFAGLTAGAVLRNTLRELLRPPAARLRRRYGLRDRRFVLVPVDGRDMKGRPAPVCDLQPDTVHTIAPPHAAGGSAPYFWLARKHRSRRRMALCRASSIRPLSTGGTAGPVYAVTYEAVSPRHRYTLARHILRQTVA